MGAAQFGDITMAEKSQYLVLSAQSLINLNQGEFTANISRIAAMAEEADPQNQMAVFVNSLAIENSEPRDQAIEKWRDFLDRFGAQPNELTKRAENKLFQLQTEISRGPTDQQMQDALRMTGAERSEMINNMVAGLAARLEDDPSDLGGWVQLMRSYIVLKRPDDARQALKQAKIQFQDDAMAQKTLLETSNSLGIE